MDWVRSVLFCLLFMGIGCNVLPYPQENKKTGVSSQELVEYCKNSDLVFMAKDGIWQQRLSGSEIHFLKNCDFLIPDCNAYGTYPKSFSFAKAHIELVVSSSSGFFGCPQVGTYNCDIHLTPTGLMALDCGLGGPFGLFVPSH